MTRNHLLLVIILLVLIFPVALASGSSEYQVDEGTDVARTQEEALRYDAMWYAEYFGVSPEEAIRRLSLTSSIEALYAALARGEEDSFAGAWVTHLPEHSFHIAFVNNSNVDLSPYLKNSPLKEMVRLESATYSYRELREVQRGVIRQLNSELGMPAIVRINQEKNKIEIGVLNVGPAMAVVRSYDQRLQDMIDVSVQKEPLTLELNDYAGLPQSRNSTGSRANGTSGFVVHNSSKPSLKYHSTAGHIDGSVYLFAGTPNRKRLPLYREYYGGAFDFQLHRIPSTLTPKPWAVDNVAYDGTPYYREITNWLYSFYMTPGNQVCHYGVTSGYSCGFIRANDVCLTVDGESGCPYIEVSGANHAGGDSGGPWFFGSSAYGIHTAGSGQYSYFMPAEAFAWKGFNVYTTFTVP